MPSQPRATLDNPYGPQVTFRTEDVLPPSAYYISPEDRVTVWVMTDVTVQTIYLQLRMLMATGEIKIIPYQFTPGYTYNWYPAFEMPPWEGYLLGALCFSSNPQRGQCYVSVQVMRGAPPDLRAAGVVLMQGYINNLNVLSYPTSTLGSTGDGRGAFLTVGSDPAQGAPLSITVPTNTLWKVHSLAFLYATSSAVANRQLALYISDINNYIGGVWPSNYVQAASITERYTLVLGGQSMQTGGYVQIGGPSELFLGYQSSLKATIPGMDAFDSITAVHAQVEEWMMA